jgi:hypothetical protein
MVGQVEPTEAPIDDRPVVRTRTVDIAVSLAFLGLAIFLGIENWRLGATWTRSGPAAGYFPFYLSILLGAAALWGLLRALWPRSRTADEAGVADGEPAEAPEPETFVNRDQLGRVLRVLFPFLLFVVLIQFLGIYVASFFFVSGFMIAIGRAPIWKALLTGLLFTLFMFYVFQIQFTVIMPKGPLERALGF